MATEALKIINCKTCRYEKMSFSIVHQGYEPLLFKMAFFGGWNNFEQPELLGSKKDQSCIDEESSQSSGMSGMESSEEEIVTECAPGEVVLDKESLRMSSRVLVCESCWLN